MDTSETYITMCEKAEEIQKNLIKPTVMTFFDENERRLPLRIGSDGSFFWAESEIWLPRQDQLQEMVKGNKHMHLLAHEFAVMFHGSDSPFDRNLHRDNYTVDSDNSMEQMWLAFVMKEKYNKVWDVKNWEKVKEEAIRE